MAVFFDHFSGSVRAEGYQIHDFFINRRACFLRVRPEIFGIAIAHIPHLIAHSQLSHNAVGDLVSLFKVICCSVGTCAVELLLSASSAEDEANLVDELCLRVEFVLVVEILGEAE